ncbi:MAG: hypothetical protein QXW97_03800 [Candidatus Pacearchaeota archaeon]
MVEKNNIQAIFTFEMLGKPSNFVKESLEEYIDNLKNIVGVKIISKKIHEPKEIDVEKVLKNSNEIKKEDSKELYSCFSEVEIEVENISLLFNIVFRLLPSHVEIISPQEIRFKNFDIADVLNELAIKLHRYDEVAKVLTLEKQHLEKELQAFKIKNIKFEELDNKSKK